MSSAIEGLEPQLLWKHFAVLSRVPRGSKNKVHDFTKDPIELVREGNVLRANGTTLGADNGVGVAAALAVAEDRFLEHGPLEMLFTIDEETGLTGAKHPPRLDSRRRQAECHPARGLRDLTR